MNVYGKILNYFPFFSFFIFTYRMDQKTQRMKSLTKLQRGWGFVIFKIPAKALR